MAIRRQLKALEEAGYIRTVRKYSGRGTGSETHRFCSDRKISDYFFEQLKEGI